MKKEQEDLLVLLTDQDTKLSSYRKRLRQLGETTTDDEDEDAEEDLDLSPEDEEDLKW